MIKSHFKTALRQLERYRLFTALNVFGLAIGISACLIIYQIVHYEFSYENKLPAKDRIYRLLTGRIFDEKEAYYGGVSAPIYRGIREELPAMARVVPLYTQWVRSVQIPSDAAEPMVVAEPQDVAATDSAYFDMVSYSWLAGSKHSAFSAPENVVLTESRAKTYFPIQTPKKSSEKPWSTTTHCEKPFQASLKTWIIPPNLQRKNSFI